MDLQIWGLKTVSFFDWWSIEHYFSGISVGALIYFAVNGYIKRKKYKIEYKDILKLQFIILFGLNYFWETLEHYLEEGIAGQKIEHWFYGVEHWTNRMISDPILVFLGWATIMWYFKYIQKYDFNKRIYLLLFARIYGITWLVVNIFIFPHSMYLHDILF